jgi:hypothetical protein
MFYFIITKEIFIFIRRTFWPKVTDLNGLFWFGWCQVLPDEYLHVNRQVLWMLKSTGDVNLLCPPVPHIWYTLIMYRRPIVFKEWRDTRTFSNLKSTHCTSIFEGHQNFWEFVKNAEIIQQCADGNVHFN